MRSCYEGGQLSLPSHASSDKSSVIDFCYNYGIDDDDDYAADNGAADDSSINDFVVNYYIDDNFATDYGINDDFVFAYGINNDDYGIATCAVDNFATTARTDRTTHARTFAGANVAHGRVLFDRRKHRGFVLGYYRASMQL